MPYKILGVVVLAVTQAVAQNSSQPASPATSGALPNTVQDTNGTELPAAHPISTVDPKYPKEAKRQKKQGQVVLRARIGEDGKVKDLSVISGDADFAAAATQAVKKWRFQPYLVDGKPTEAEQSVTINFKLENDAASAASQSRSNEDFNREVDEQIAAGKLFRPGVGVSPPKLLHYEDPDYTQAAKDARVQGVGVLHLIVGADGVPAKMHVVRALGYGLDDKAMEAVQRWRFKPATKDGQPVAVVINVEVTFHLY